MEDTLEKLHIPLSSLSPLYRVDTPCCPSMHRRIYVAERPFIGGDLSIRMLIPFAQKQDQLMLGIMRID